MPEMPHEPAESPRSTLAARRRRPDVGSIQRQGCPRQLAVFCKFLTGAADVTLLANQSFHLRFTGAGGIPIIT